MLSSDEAHTGLEYVEAQGFFLRTILEQSIFNHAQ